MTQFLWFFGTCFSIIADHTTTAGQYDLLEGYFPPGKQTPLHRHTRYSEQLYVLEGEVTIWAGENKVVLSTGDHFFIPAGIPHAVGVVGDRPAQGLVMTAPSGFARLVAATGTSSKTEAPDMELFMQICTEIGDEILTPPEALPDA
jgi:mannose-6-phosphate isomerase-like protein (cupin superfamily)